MPDGTVTSDGAVPPDANLKNGVRGRKCRPGRRIHSDKGNGVGREEIGSYPRTLFGFGLCLFLRRRGRDDAVAPVALGLVKPFVRYADQFVGGHGLVADRARDA